MARSSPIQTTFNGGEFSPRMFGRVDVDKYGTSVETMENFIATVQGPALRRSGTRFVGEAIDSTVKSRLIPFVYSDQQAYVLEFSENKITVFTLEARLRPGTFEFAPSAIGTGTDRITIPDFSYADQQGPFRFTNSGGSIFTESTTTPISVSQDYYIRRIAGSNDDFQISETPAGAIINIDGTGSGTHTITPQAGALGIKIDTTYLESQLFDIQFAQSADTLYLTHSLHSPKKLERVGVQNWRLTDIEFWDGPYETENTTDTTITPGAVTGDGVAFDASADLFSANDVGRHIRVFEPATPTHWGWGVISQYNNATQVLVDIKRDLTGTDAVETWRLGSWYIENYPRCVTFHEQRLVFAGIPSSPQRFDGSVIGDFENFMPTGGEGGPVRTTGSTVLVENEIAADFAYAFTISSDQVNNISWLSATRNLLVGTLGGIWPVQATSNLEVISPENINVRRSSARGAAPLTPVAVDDATVYLSRTNRRLMEVAYEFQSDSFVPVDLSILADHIPSPEIVQLDYSIEPDSIVWALRADGELAGLSLDRQQDVRGWHRQILGGNFGGEKTVIESIAVIPAPRGSVTPGAHANERHDQLWMIAKRTINSVTKRHVEFLEDRFPDTADQADGFFVDSGLTYSGSPASVISNLDHLEGETVKVMTDGAVHPERVVSSGTITLQYPSEVVHIGLPLISTLKTLRLEAGDPQGPSQGKRKRIDHILLRLYRTIGLEIAEDAAGTSYDPVVFRLGSDPMDAPPPLFTGDKILPIDVGWETEGQIKIRAMDPTPVSILAIGYRVDSSQRGTE